MVVFVREFSCGPFRIIADLGIFGFEQCCPCPASRSPFGPWSCTCRNGLIGLGFSPTGEDKSVPDIAGTMWIDLQTAELQWLEYTYQYLDPDQTSSQVGGRVDFERMPDGTWIVPEWWIRVPVMAVQFDSQGRSRQFVIVYCQYDLKARRLYEYSQ